MTQGSSMFLKTCLPSPVARLALGYRCVITALARKKGAEHLCSQCFPRSTNVVEMKGSREDARCSESQWVQKAGEGWVAPSRVLETQPWLPASPLPLGMDK